MVQVQQFLLAFGSFLFSFSCLYGCIVVFHCVFNLQFPSRCHLEKAMAPHSSTRAWKIPWTEESGAGWSPWGCWGSDMTERLHFHFSLSCIGEGNGNPLQCSCLETPRDGGAWWAAIYGVAQSRTRLTWLSSMKSGCTMLLVLFLLKIALTTHGLCGSHKF